MIPATAGGRGGGAVGHREPTPLHAISGAWARNGLTMCYAKSESSREGTPIGGKANWLTMEVPFFDYHLKAIGEPFPRVVMQATDDASTARFQVNAPRPLTKVEVYWAKANPDVTKREWLPLPATKVADNVYEAKLPAEAADWFALASDESKPSKHQRSPQTRRAIASQPFALRPPSVLNTTHAGCPCPLAGAVAASIYLAR